jgi:hypothetical protein
MPHHKDFGGKGATQSSGFAYTFRQPVRRSFHTSVYKPKTFADSSKNRC